MLGGLAAAVAIILFVTAHEAGHFLAAKAVGMKATEFFFGFGPKIWSTKKGETEYGFKWIPLGGYVRIVGMNPLEEVEPDDVGRTYREKRFWEKSVVVLAGVGMNFLIAFFIFYGIVIGTGVQHPQPVVDVVEPTVVAAGGDTVATPASLIGLQSGDVILQVGPYPVSQWADIPTALEKLGAGPTTLTIDRSGETMVLDVDLVLRESPETGVLTGFLGVAPAYDTYRPGPIEAVGIAGQDIWTGISFTFGAIGDMLKPSSLAQYLGVFAGQTQVDENIRPVSPIGIVNIGTQAQNSPAFFGLLALVNVILATINLLPLFPLDGGHFAVALYERVTGRQANMRKLMPVAAAVVGLFAFLGFVAIILDIVNPISL